MDGQSVWFCGTPVTCQSKMMPILALSVIEAELYIPSQCAMDMMSIQWVMVYILGLKVKLRMRLKVNNMGCADFCNNRLVDGRTRHFEIKHDS